ncbi:hypothetical protein ACTPOK_05075 [Streptomyces inhibens]|uniref:hypothetical protein n=1 Tax=Streptomyces inhibens TaxID=2293571 RepID=UPI00402AA10B
MANPEEKPVLGNRQPHSITIGPDKYLWVTTHNNALVKVHPDSMESQSPIVRDIPKLTAGIIADPDANRDRKCVWFASPSDEQSPDPIYEFDIEDEEFKKHDLEPTARAQTVTSMHVQDLGSRSVGGISGENDPTYSYYIVFAEPVFSYVGHIKSGERPVTRFHLPKNDDEFNTWLWSVAVSVEDKYFTYWATGQKRNNRKTNGLYFCTPRRTGLQWQRIEMPLSPEQTPIHVITDSRHVWFGTSNPNKLCRYNILDPGMTQSEYTLPDEPRQLVFGPDNMIWVAGKTHLHRFRKDAAVKHVSSVALPTGSEAQGLCISPGRVATHGSPETNAVVWYTSPVNRKIGRYVVPNDPSHVLGKTQLVRQPVDTVAPGELVEVPLVASYVANASPTPGIPLTCRLVVEDPLHSTTAFTDGSRECVIITDTNGRAYVPPLRAGVEEEEVQVQIGYSDTEPPTCVPLTIKQPEQP